MKDTTGYVITCNHKVVGMSTSLSSAMDIAEGFVSMDTPRVEVHDETGEIISGWRMIDKGLAMSFGKH